MKATDVIDRYQSAFEAVHGHPCQVRHRGNGWYQIAGRLCWGVPMRSQQLMDMARELEAKARK